MKKKINKYIFIHIIYNFYKSEDKKICYCKIIIVI